MSDTIGTMSTETGKVAVVIDGESKRLPYREAVGLISRGLASWEPEKPKQAKKSDLPADTVKAVDSDDAGNKPLPSE